MRYVNKTEKRIINGLLNQIDLIQGIQMRVYDGEEYYTDDWVTVSEGQKDIGETDETTLFFRNALGEKIGYIWFIHGNNEDVVADWGNHKGFEWFDKLVHEELRHLGVL